MNPGRRQLALRLQDPSGVLNLAKLVVLLGRQPHVLVVVRLIRCTAKILVRPVDKLLDAPGQGILARGRRSTGRRFLRPAATTRSTEDNQPGQGRRDQLPNHSLSLRPYAAARILRRTEIVGIAR